MRSTARQLLSCIRTLELKSHLETTWLLPRVACDLDRAAEGRAMFNNDGGKYFEDVRHLIEDGNLAVRREEFVDLIPQLLRQSVAVIPSVSAIT